jgi:hypothetical protein
MSTLDRQIVRLFMVNIINDGYTDLANAIVFSGLNTYNARPKYVVKYEKALFAGLISLTPPPEGYAEAKQDAEIVQRLLDNCLGDII